MAGPPTGAGAPAGAPAGLRGEILATLALAAPIALALLAEIAMTVANTVQLGALGPVALGAGGLAAQLLFMPELIGIGVLTASGAIAAQAVGAGDRPKVAAAIAQGMRLALLLSIPGLLLLAALPPLLRAMGHEPAVVTLIGRYLATGCVGLPIALVLAALRNFLLALARPRFITLLMLGAVGLRILLNDLLIHGRLGLPALGVSGAGLASSLTYAAMLAAAAAYIGLHPAYRGYRLMAELRRGRWRLLGEILRVGWPTGVVLAAESGLFMATGMLMGLFGRDPLAAHQIVITTTAITFMLPLALAQAATVRVGHAVGAGEVGRVRRVGETAIGLGIAWMTLSATVLTLAPRLIVGGFIDIADAGNAAVVAVALQLLPIAALFQVFDGLQVVASGALRGLKDTRVPMLIGVVGYWAIGLTIGPLLGFWLRLGPTGLWWGLALGLVTSGLLLAWRFHRRSGPHLA
jgi:MATE family multidrug resistance protein